MIHEHDAGITILPEDLARAMLEHAGHSAKLDEEIDGEVAL